MNQKIEPTFDELFIPANRLAPFSSVPTPLRPKEVGKDEIRIKFSLKHKYNAFLLKNISDHKSTLNVARNIYFHGSGKWLVGLVDGIIAVCTHTNCTSFDEYVLENSNSVAITCKPDHLWPEALAHVFLYSTAFELNRSHNWIQVHSTAITMTIADIITVLTNSHKNVPVLKMSVDTTTADIVILTHVHKYYPIDVNELQSNGNHVVALPFFKDGICTLSDPRAGQAPPKLQTALGLREYWWETHGYLLSDHTASVTASVNLSGKPFLYPSVCVWKHNWSFLPSHTQEYIPRMHQRMDSELASILACWEQSYPGEISLAVNQAPFVNAANSAVNHKFTKRKRQAEPN